MFNLMRAATAILTLGCLLSLIKLNQAIQNDTNSTSDFTQTASTISLKSVQFLTTLAGNGDDESSPPLSSSTLTSILKRDRSDSVLPNDKVPPSESRVELDEEEDRDEDENDNNENENETILAKLDMSSQMGSSESIDRNDSTSIATGSTPSVAAVYQDGPQREYTGSPTKGGKNFHHTEDNSFTMSSSSDLNGHQQHHEICDFCIYDGEGNFTSYGYPLPYRANLNCSYRVQRGKADDVCQLDLIFHDFDVPVTSVAGVGPKIGGIHDCHEDYLQVGNKRYCGSDWRDRTEIIPFPMGQKEVTFFFVSNERVSGRGFWVEVRKRPGTCYTKKMMKGCEERYSDPEFYITSPQFPSGYPNNAECTYYIRRSDQSVCGLEIKFLHFDLEAGSSGNECLFDYVQIDGEKFCGTMTPQTVKQFKFIEDQKVIVFHSDKQVPRSGFHLLVRQLKQCSQGPSLPPPPTCNICTNERRGLLVSYGYPNQYRNNLHCTYSIEKYDSSICSLELHFMDFEVMPSLDCSEDYLTIDGVQYCGTTLHSTKRMVEFGANKTIEMIFHTNPTSNSRGFSARYRQILCSSMNMIANESPKNGHRDITTSSSSTKDTRPQSTPSSVDPSSLPPISSSTTSQTTLTTPSIGSSTSATDTNGKMVALNCDKTYHEKHFLLQSFNFSNNYPNNMDCTYLIFRNTSKVCYLELTFLQFDVEPSPQCQYDYLEVNSVRLCGTLQRETTRTYIFNDPEKMIKFHSDNSSNRSGFLIQAEQLECHGDAIIRNMSDGTANIPGAVGTTSVSDPSIPFFPCDQLFSDQSFEIISPLYPSPYPKNSDCVYMVKKVRPNICRLEVTFFDFDLQGINDYGYCANDYLDFNGIRMCGSVEKGNVRNYYFPESKFSIRFHADSLLSGRGFRLGLRQTDCDVNTIEPKLPDSGSSSLPPVTSLSSPLPPPISKTNPPATTSNHNGGTKRIHTNQCDQVYGENFVEIMSPRYPANYPPSISCQYTIVKQTNAGPICQLEVNILELELDESASCQGDFLDFEHEIVCGSVASKTVKVFPFDRPEFLIRFKSDSHEVPAGRRAFHIQVRQRECPDGFSVTPPKSPSIGTTNDPNQETAQKRPEYCSSNIKSIRFELKSQNFPTHYENNLDCTYIIQRNHDDICNMDLFFIDFELEDDKDCRFDYISIQGQKFCGTIKSGTIQTYSFANQSEIIIRFQTDRANSAKGFHIRGVQRECGPKYDPQNSQHQNVSTHHQTTITSPSTSVSPHHLPVAPSICEVCFASREGVIKSYNFPNSYPADLSCNYRIAGLQDHCAVYLKFENFELEEPKNGLCTEDYLEIEDVRYCGNQLSGIQKLLDFHGDPKEIFMRFHSNSYLSGRGFKILYAQIPCSNLIAINQVPITKTTQHHTGYGQHPDRQIPQIVAGSEPISVLEAKDRNEPDSPASRIPCDLVVFDSKFEISTPGYPFAYPVRSDCLFSIRRANYNVCKLKLEFDTFDLESSPHCRSDQLEIEGEKLCGSLPSNTTREYEFHNYKLALRFRSDEQGSSRGFLIRGQQIECPPGSKQSGPYPANSADVPTYTPPDDNYPFKSHNYPYGGSILPPSNLPHPSASGVNYEIPDYHDSKGRPDTSPSFPSSSSSSSGSSNGYSSDSVYHDRYPSGSSSSSGESQTAHESEKGSYYPQSSHGQSSCDKTIVDSFFDIKSPGYPFRYPASSRCSLVIKKATPEVCHLDLMFVGFDVGSSSCSSDYFAVDGERFCGTIESGQVKTFRFDLPEKFVFFSGDLSQGIGYHIRGRQVECSPPHYQSSSLPSSRPGNIGSVLSSSISRSSELSAYSHSSNNNLIDRSSMSSGSSGSSPLPYCDQTFATGEFTIMSPNHPNSYPNNLYCRYTIVRSSTSACALDITFKNFDLEETSDCSKDYLEIDGSRICGLLPPLHQRRYNYFPHEKEKTFIFRSDSYGSKSGFSIHVTQATGCRSYSDLMHRSEQSEDDGSTNIKPSRSQCNQCMKDVMGQITSDGYPSRYSDNTDCNYRISAAGPQYCKVLIYLRDLDIETSEACDRDYLFVEGQRLCNTNFRKPKEMTIYYPEFGPREITFSFHSDGKGTGRGFFLDFIQQSCSVSVPSMPVQHASTMSRSPTYPANHVAKATIEEIVETRVQVLDQRPPITQYQQHRQQNVHERITSDRSFNSRSHRTHPASASVHIPRPPSQMLRTHLANQSSRDSQSNIHPDPDFHSVSARDTIYVEEASRRKN